MHRRSKLISKGLMSSMRNILNVGYIKSCLNSNMYSMGNFPATRRGFYPSYIYIYIQSKSFWLRAMDIFLMEVIFAKSRGFYHLYDLDLFFASGKRLL